MSKDVSLCILNDSNYLAGPVSSNGFNGLDLGTLSRSKQPVFAAEAFFSVSRHFVTTGPRGLLLVTGKRNESNDINMSHWLSLFRLTAILTTLGEHIFAKSRTIRNR